MNSACDELGGVFGLKGHGFAAYGLPFTGGGKTGEAGDEVGNVPYRAVFSSLPGGASSLDLVSGGRASVFQWWSIAEVAWGRAVLLSIDPGSQSVSECDEVSLPNDLNRRSECLKPLLNFTFLPGATSCSRSLCCCCSMGGSDP